MRGTAYWEAEGLKVTPPPLTGHMTQDPRDPCQWTWGYGVNGSVVTGHDALVTVETLRGSPHEAMWGRKGVGLHDFSQGTLSSFS